MESESAYREPGSWLLILAASATKWLSTELRGSTLQCLPARPAPSLCWTASNGSRYAFFFSCHQQFIYIRHGDTSARVSWFKITFRADDACAADCWVAARSRSSSPTSPALSLSSRGMERCPRVESDIRGNLREMRRTCHSLSRGDAAKARGYKHSGGIWGGALLSLWSPPQRPDRETLREKWPILPIWPHIFYQSDTLQQLDLLTFHTSTSVHSCALPCAPLD